MSKSDAQIQILGGTPDRGTRGERAPGGAMRAALEELRKSRVFMALLWSRAPRFDARLRTVPLVPPFAYKYPGISRARGEKF